MVGGRRENFGGVQAFDRVAGQSACQELGVLGSERGTVMNNITQFRSCHASWTVLYTT